MELERAAVQRHHSGLMKSNTPMVAHLLHHAAQSLDFVDLWKNGTMGSSGTAMGLAMAHLFWQRQLRQKKPLDLMRESLLEKLVLHLM